MNLHMIITSYKCVILLSLVNYSSAIHIEESLQMSLVKNMALL